MSRTFSVPESEASKDQKGGDSLYEDVDRLEAVRSRHVGIGIMRLASAICCAKANNPIADEPHPHLDAQRERLGLDLNEEIEIVDWDGPGDPENPSVSTGSRRSPRRPSLTRRVDSTGRGRING
jgi:hypothetical protein